MKIAIATRFLHRAGGIETYLEHALPVLQARGHEIAIWYEVDLDRARGRFLPETTPSWQMDVRDREVSALKHWAPDIVFMHGLSDPDLEATFARDRPSVLLLHDYSGTCISGTKMHRLPMLRACSRPLGPGCLFQYYPRRCGGWHPLTMIRSYTRQRMRQQLLRRCTYVATLSAHMSRQCVREGIEPARVRQLPAFAPRGCAATEVDKPDGPRGARWHVLFAGRMEKPKGGAILVRALGALDRRLCARLRVTFAGDGRERARWERAAKRLARRGIEVRFVGWISAADRTALLQEADLLVVPSVWPEPLALIGLEAAAAGVPAIAFDVGGVGEWLVDGVTGRLLPAPPSASALAAAIDAAFSGDRSALASWRLGALQESRRRTIEHHVDELERLLLAAVSAGAQDLGEAIA